MDAVNDRQLALVTGASSGIGYELAKQLGERGYDLVINAEDDLGDAQRELMEAGVNVEVFKADLAKEKNVEKLHKHLRRKGTGLDVAALNAGIGEGGDFARQTGLAKELQLVDLNVRSTVHLSKLIVADMLERGSGRVLFTSSIASTMPGAYQAVYNASKSFVQSFALALRNELRDTNVTITSLMPGPTDTEFFERANMDDTKVGADEKDDPAKVAEQGLDALMAGRERVVAGSLMNKVQVAAGRFIPDRAKAEMHRRMAAPGSAKDN
jgi:short-subunit dehydrogenase